MRLYTFCNYYLSSIQQGIQSGHILGEICKKYLFPKSIDANYHTVGEFLHDHKTMVVCNGGNAADIHALRDFFNRKANIYPWAEFYEDEYSMEGVMTGVGIILPEEIYDIQVEFELREGQRVKIFKQVEVNGKTTWIRNTESYEYQLIDRIKSAPLAR